MTDHGFSVESLLSTSRHSSSASLLTEEEARELIQSLRLDQPGQVKLLLQKALHIPTAFQAFSAIEETREDHVKQSQMLTHSLLDAAVFGYSLGLNSRALGAWISIVKKSHDRFIEGLREKQSKSDAVSHLKIFQDQLMSSSLDSSDSTHHHIHHHTSRGALFTRHEALKMIEYYSTVHVQHTRLFAWVFSKSQGRRQTQMVKFAQEPPLPRPLKEGIAAEKWEDWCKQEEERLRKENELAQMKLEKARLEAEEEARVTLAKIRYEEDMKLQKEAEAEILNSFDLPKLGRIPIFGVSETFSSFGPVLEKLNRLQLENKNNSNATLLEKTLSSLVTNYSHELEQSLSQLLSSREIALNSKFEQLKLTLDKRSNVQKPAEAIIKKK